MLPLPVGVQVGVQVGAAVRAEVRAPARAARARAAAALGLVAAAATLAALWPGAGVPAWPGATTGLGAVALALGPGPIGAKATATLLGGGAAMLGALQIGVLWAAAGALP